MDHLYSVKSQLDFLRKFYMDAEIPFKMTQREIVKNVNTGSQDLHLRPDEPLEEWAYAVRSIELLGQVIVINLEKVLHSFIMEVVCDKGGPDPRDKKGSWLDQCGRFLEAKTQFRWQSSPVDKSRIEQINLSRNDFVHGPNIDSQTPVQSDYHFERYPSSRFTDMLHLAVSSALDGHKSNSPMPLSVNGRLVFEAIADVRSFCEYIETVRDLVFIS